MSPYRTDPTKSGRHPFETYMLSLATVASVPVVFGAAPEPGSIEASLPSFAVFAWSLILAIGCVIALVGTFWPERATGLIAEQLGLAFVGVAAVVYAGAILAEIGTGGILPASIIAGFGAACLKRWRDLQAVLDAVHAEEKRRRGEA